MPKYNVNLYYTSTITYVVEADTPEEAEEKAKDIEEPYEDFCRKLAEDVSFEDSTVFDENWVMLV